jgi:hypothetical protein
VWNISLILTESKIPTPSQQRGMRDITLFLTEGKTPTPSQQRGVRNISLILTLKVKFLTLTAERREEYIPNPD